MKKNKTIKIISFLIVIFFIFQLIPTNVTQVEGFKTHTQNSKVILASTSINSDILCIGRQSNKASFHNLQIKIPLSMVHQAYYFDVSLVQSFSKEEPFDHRTVIRQCIPHYFNGSKYKREYFDI